MSENSVTQCNSCNEALQELRDLDCYKAIIKRSETWADDDIAEAKAILKSEKEEVTFQTGFYSTALSGTAVVVALLSIISKFSIIDMVISSVMMVTVAIFLVVYVVKYISNKSKVVSLSKQISALDDIITRRKGENYAKNL